jgi:hypothetical protein
MNSSDKKILEDLIKLRISVDALERTKLNTNTNRNEGDNRALSASLPKNVSFGRNAPARAHAATHRINWGHGESLLRKLSAVGSPVTKGGRVASFITSMQHRSVYFQAHKKSKLAKVGMLKRKVAQIRAYYRARDSRRGITQHDCYRKGQLDPKPGTSACGMHKERVRYPRRRGVAVWKQKRNQDHTYADF